MTWTIDSSHTSVEFAVKHMAIATVRGRFRSVKGTIETTDDGKPILLEATIDAASIDTAEPNRDAHLRSADFLDAEHYPEIHFVSTSVEPLGSRRFRVMGDLSIRGETHPVTLKVERTEPINDPFGNMRVAAQATGELNRKDWGLTWNQVLEFGALLVGEEVRLSFDVQAITPEPVAAATA